MEHKSIRASAVKVGSEGKVTAKFATLGVKDHDGDIIEPGAFGKQKVRVSSFGHGSWMGELPVGVGTIHEKDDSAIAELGFFMDTQTGREHFEVVKALGDLGEWSFSFSVDDQGVPDEAQREKGVKRILKKLSVDEVSPVLKGAGIDTRTLAVKRNAGTATVASRRPEAFVSPPNPTYAKIAGFALQIAEVLRPRLTTTFVKWVEFDGAHLGSYDHETSTIKLASTDCGELEVIHTVLHESEHARQPPYQWNEKAAESFAEKYSEVVFRAGRAGSWDASRVRVQKTARPSDGKQGLVVITTGLGRPRVWRYDFRHAGNAWQPA